ncbi:MAG: hypothetical protein ABJA60_11220 [Nitrosospira sp.]
MKTARSLALSLVFAIGFAPPLAWGGEPNTDAFGSGQSANVGESNNPRAMSGDCGPDLTYVDDPRAD